MISIASTCRAMRWKQPAPRSRRSARAVRLRHCCNACIRLPRGPRLLLNGGKSLAAEVKDFRLGLEIAVIQAFADRIVRLLKVRDPLSERVHLNPVELSAFSIAGVAGEMTRRAIGLHPQSKPAAGA